MLLIEKALSIIRTASTERGILATASPVKKDNYQRVWSRDAMMSGIAGILHDDEVIIEAFYQSLSTLAQGQHRVGMIPSNVDLKTGKVSYGSVVGRVDACTWFLCGVGMLGLAKRRDIRKQFEENVERCIALLDAWEYNGKGLLYVPMSGNWADEYVTQGYILYDQLLRLWGMAMCARFWERKDWMDKAFRLRQAILGRYQHTQDNSSNENMATSPLANLPYWACSWGAFGYDKRFDMSANALASMLFPQEPKSVETLLHIEKWAKENHSWLLPAFYPILKEGDADWHYLKNNYSYQFKNKPYHFHNGGIWPIFLGWLGVAFSLHDKRACTQAILKDVESHLQQYPNFYEYIASDTFQPGGTSHLCFSATGLLFLYAFSDQNKNRLKDKNYFTLSSLLVDL